MSDTFIPTGSSGSPPGFQRRDNSAETIIIRAAPVISLPDQALPPRAEVVSLPRVPEGQIRLRTPAGDVVISAPNVKLPEGTLVNIEIDAAVTPPTITLRTAPQLPPPLTSQPDAGAAPVTPLPVQPQTPTTVTTGEKILAIILSTTPAPPAPEPPMPSGIIIQKLATISLAQPLPADLPLTSAQILNLVAAPDPEAFLKTLPLVTQEKLKVFLTQPNIQPVIQSLQIDEPVKPATPTPPYTPQRPPETDDPTITLLRTQGLLKIYTQVTTGPAPTPRLNGPLGGLFDFIQTLLGDKPALNAPAQVYPAIQSSIKDAQNFTELTILRVITPQQKETPFTLPANLRPEEIIEGVVIGKTSDGRPIIQTPRMDVVLHQPAELPVDTKIVMTAQPLSLADFASRVLTAPLFTLSLQSSADELNVAIEEALTVLAARTPQTANALQNSLPAVGPKMVPTTLFFLAALRLGVIENWLGGPALQQLRDAGRRDLAEKLGSDFSRLNQQARETMPGDWRGFSLPLMQDNSLQHLQFYYRSHNDDSNKENTSDKTTRFVVNVSLSRMGDLQLDGLLRKPAQAQSINKGQLDLILRSDAAFDMALQQDLRRAFTRGLEEGKLSGSLQFQAHRQGWQTITPATDSGQMA